MLNFQREPTHFQSSIDTTHLFIGFNYGWDGIAASMPKKGVSSGFGVA